MPADVYEGPERRLIPGEHCNNHEANTKDISSIKGWIRGILIVGAIVGFFMSRYMDGIDANLTKIVTVLEKTDGKVTILVSDNAVTRTEVEQLKKDVDDIKEQMRRLHPHGG